VRSERPSLNGYEDFDEVWKLIDREAELRRAIESKFAAYWYVDHLDALRQQLEWGSRRLRVISGRFDTWSGDEAALSDAYLEFRFLNFGLVSLSLSMQDLLFKSSADLRCAKAVDTLARALKYEAPMRLVHELRNRLQHGRMILGRLHVEARTKEHPAGAGISVVFDLGDSEWEALMGGKVNADAKNFYEEQLKGKPNRLARALEAATAAVSECLQNVTRAFNEAYATEIKQQVGLEAELSAVNLRLAEIGFHARR
jgi:hypothetical protein